MKRSGLISVEIENSKVIWQRRDIYGFRGSMETELNMEHGSIDIASFYMLQ